MSATFICPSFPTTSEVTVAVIGVNRMLGLPAIATVVALSIEVYAASPGIYGREFLGRAGTKPRRTWTSQYGKPAVFGFPQKWKSGLCGSPMGQRQSFALSVRTVLRW